MKHSMICMYCGCQFEIEYDAWPPYECPNACVAKAHANERKRAAEMVRNFAAQGHARWWADKQLMQLADEIERG